MAFFGASMLFLGAGCGQPLVDSSYRGNPVTQIQGQVNWEGDGAAPDAGPLRAALFFAPNLQSVDPSQWHESLDSSTPVVGIPSPFTMNIFAYPSPALFVADAGANFALGRILVYSDSNGDGHFNPGESILGIEPQEAWLYAPSNVDAAHSPTGRALPKGLTHVILPQQCVPPPGPTTPGTCGVPLGAHCDDDSDCGTGGFCLKETKMPWPAGYCTLTEPVPPGGCRPGAGVFEGAPRYSLVPPEVVGFWLRRCSTDADCVRPADHGRANLYVCDPGLGACTPNEPGGLGVPLGGPLEVEPFCASSTRGH